MQKSKEKVTCAFCRGAGQARDGGVCQVCRGAGMVSLAAPVRRCTYCRGSGLQQRGSALTCGVCRGAGWVTVPEDAVSCPPCGGTGVASSGLGDSNLPCLICQGKGVVSAERAKNLPPGKKRPRWRGRGYDSGGVALEY